MNPIYQHYIIDLSSDNNFVQIPTMQGDGNRIRGFEVELIQNGMQYSIDRDDTLISIIGTKPDTKQIMNPCEVTEDGYILVDITSQMSAVTGRGDYQIILISRSTNSQLKSFPFHILTTPTVFDASDITSSNEFQTLTQNIARTEEVIDNANLAISDMRQLEAYVSEEEAKRAEAENARVYAENTRDSAEAVRISNENTRKEKETERESAEAVRITAENGRITSENARIEAENVRIESEIIREENERIRKTNEDTRNANELDRQNAEAVRISAEITRIENENNRSDAEQVRDSAETQRLDAEETRIENECLRQDNESSRQVNESARQTNTAAAISDAETATERANTAAKLCENIAAGTTAEILSPTEPADDRQNVGDFWLLEY